MAQQGAIAAPAGQVVITGQRLPLLGTGRQHRQLGVLQAVLQRQHLIGTLILTWAQSMGCRQHLAPALAVPFFQLALVAVGQSQQLYTGVFAQHYLAFPQQLPIHQDAHRQRDAEEVVGKTIRQIFCLL